MAQSTRNTEVQLIELTSKSATWVFGEFCLLTETAQNSTRDSSFCFGHCPCIVTVKQHSEEESATVAAEKWECSQ